MTTHSLTINIVADPNAGIIAPEDGYWLTIEQVLPDEKITAGEAARMIDALFDLSPCKDPIESGTEPAEEPPEDMAEALDKIAEKVEVDLTACERRLTGTYQTDLKIVRSHPDIPYTLRLSVGDILETVLVESQVAENLDVKAASSVTLTMPVMSGLACTWLGTVFGPNGPIDPPIIKAAGNTLFWAGVATGTIRAEYASIHDVVTVEIPGIPNYVGSERGEPQGSTALAFYHYQVFPCDITPPPDDSDATLAEVCGWYNGPQYGFPEEEAPPEPPPPPEIEYGCITNASFPLLWEVDSPEFYEARCCVPGTPPHGNCRVWSSRLEGGKDLSEETRAQMTAEWPGPIEFIGLGPITPEGCGTKYEETKIVQHNCCDEVEPMAWDTETSGDVVAPGSRVLVGVTGGHAPYHWSVRGQGFSLDGATLRDGTTDTNYVWIYASDLACGYCPIEVNDGCSIVNDGIKSTDGEWVKTAEYYSPNGIDVCPIMGSCPDDVTDTGYGGFNMTTEQQGIKISQQKYTAYVDGEPSYLATEALAYESCMAQYNRMLANHYCITYGDQACRMCASGPPYVPCQNKAVSNYDPDLLISCQTWVTGWYSYRSGWWWPEFGEVYVRHTVVYQYRC